MSLYFQRVIHLHIQTGNTLHVQRNWTFDFIWFAKAAEHWILLLEWQRVWRRLPYLDSAEDRGFRLLTFLQPTEDRRLRDFALSQPAKHRRAGKALAWRWCVWTGLSIFTLTIINLVGCDILREGLLILMFFQNPYGLGQYLTKTNFRRCNIPPWLCMTLCVLLSP